MLSSQTSILFLCPHSPSCAPDLCHPLLFFPGSHCLSTSLCAAMSQATRCGLGAQLYHTGPVTLGRLVYIWSFCCFIQDPSIDMILAGMALSWHLTYISPFNNYNLLSQDS